jgi:hypothetical protein
MSIVFGYSTPTPHPAPGVHSSTGPVAVCCVPVQLWKDSAGVGVFHKSARTRSVWVWVCVCVFVDLAISRIYFCGLSVYMCVEEQCPSSLWHSGKQWQPLCCIVLLYLTLFSQLLVACTLNLNIASPHLTSPLIITRHNNACMVRFLCVCGCVCVAGTLCWL